MSDCSELLKWAAVRLGLRWAGFRNVRGQVCKRIVRRARELGLSGLDDYRRHLEAHSDEWDVLARLCRVTITRFGRDLHVWRRLVEHELPRLAEAATAGGRDHLSAWSAGCAGGEEPYTLSIAWELEVAPRWPSLQLDVLGTDIDEEELARAAAGTYPDGAMTELDPRWRTAGFDADNRVRDGFRARVRFQRHDLRADPAPAGPLDLILCRNLAFTYFGEEAQRDVLATFRRVLRPDGVLVVGKGETVPDGGFTLVAPLVYRP